MGKVVKKATDKHKLSLSPALTDFIEKATTLPLADLPAHLETIPSRWPFPRGDLYNWIGPLDRFDDILANFNSIYGLTDGPQVKSFGLELLLDGSTGATVEKLKELGFGPEGDRELVEAVLSFSRLLLEKCGNRTLYNSSDRLNQLLNTTELSLLHKTLRLTLFLAQRFGSRLPPQQQYHVQFYRFDIDRLLKLASPLSSFAALRAPQSPTKTSKQKDKTSQPRLRRVSTSISPNDFRALGREETATSALPSTVEEEWQAWANVKVVWSRSENAAPEQSSQSTSTQEADTDPPSSPTPVRRVPTNFSVTSNASARSSTTLNLTRDKSGVQQLDLSAQDLLRTNIWQILQDVPADMPKSTRYELLHKLRIAYALTSSSASRALLLQNRLTALSILGHVFSDEEFSHKYFDGDPNPSARQALVQQIVSLLRSPKSGSTSVSMYTTTLAMESLCILARQRTLSTEIVSAMSPVSSHGLLISLVRKGIADLQSDDPATDNEIGDDWREAIFSLYSVFISPSQPSHARSSENIVHPSLVSEYTSGLKIISDRALRIHLRILDFMKNFFHHFRDGLQVLTANGAFETACEALQKLSQQSLDLLEQGKGIPAQFKTQVTDYQIPYMHQQVMRSLIDLVNDIPNHQGNHADRALRSLVDSTALLNAFRSILSRMAAFGAHTWSEVVKAICGFLNNEPTSFTVVSEAGIITTLLQTVQPSPPAAPEEGTGRSGLTISAVPSSSPLALPPIMDAIVNLASAFAPICLTESGHKQFVDSGVLQKFFEIFESPAHVVAIKDSNTLALLGSTFDELVRHQPGLKDLVMSSVITMIARVRHICRSLSWKVGAGPKIWLQSDHELKTVSGGAPSLLKEVVANFDGLETDFHPITLPDQSTLQSGPISEPVSKTVVADATDKDEHDLTALDYARPAICFLLNFFDNHSLCKDFMNAGATDLVMDFISLPSIPVTDDSFSSSGPINELPALLHMMAEEKPHLVVPALVDRALFATEHLDELSKYCPEQVKCYFSSFLKHDASPEAMDIDSHGTTDIASRGTTLAKALMTTYSTCRVLSELFSLPIYPSRNTTNTLIHAVNVTDVLAKLVRSLGNLSAACCREEISLQSLVPLSWLQATKPGHYSSGDHDVDVILNVAEDNPAEAETPALAGDPQRPAVQRRESLSKIRETAAFLNCRTLRYLLIEVPSSINDFILRLGSSFNGKRKLETFGKQKIAQVADAIASAWIVQLDPPFLGKAFLHDNDALTKEWRFKYFDVALQNVRNSSHDDSSNSGRGKIKQTFIIDAFRRQKGLKLLTTIGTEFFDELKSCQVARPMFAANIGLKIVLELFDDLTNSSNIIASTQATFMKNMDARRPFYFNPSQVLLELRMEALTLTRKIWDSEYAEQASTDIVEKLINVLKHTLFGESENDAVQNDDNWPTLATQPRRKFALDMVKVGHLKQKGFSEALAKEALYRCNTGQSTHLPQAEEYCAAIKPDSRRRQLSMPEEEVEYRHAENADSSAAQSEPADTAMTAPLGPTATIFEDSGPDDDVADNAAVDTAADDAGDNAADGDTTDPPERNASTMEISNLLNTPQPSAPAPVSVDDVPLAQPYKTRYTVQSMLAERESIREDLPERCNNILNNHPNLVFDLNELLSAATHSLSDDQSKSWLESTTSLLVMSLVSYKIEDEMTAAQATKIASVAYLLGLLANTESFKSNMLKVFQDSFDDLVDFVYAPPTRNGAGTDGYPWIAKILLIFEKMLALDSEPAEFGWTAPQHLETASVSEPKLTHEPVLSIEQKTQLLSKICDLLPKVGKDVALALSIVRVLVILTRNRDLATKLGERQNLQKLFVMAKQLSGSASGGFEKSFMLVLRHIIEDDDTIKQIMRSEITAIFENRPSQRSFDATNYLRELYPLALRSPDLFIEVSNEKVKLKSWTSGHNLASTPLMLRTANEVETSHQSADRQASESVAQTAGDAPADSIEQSVLETLTSDTIKSVEVKPPIVERPDGVIHFLLSQLLTYKDVEEGEPTSTEQPPAEETQHEPTLDGVPMDESDIDGIPPSKSDKPRFKADEHPVFMYQCFLLHCLVELLYSYNQTKVEFINFSRKADPMAATPSKPRSGVLNYLLNALVSSGYVEKDDTIVCKKRMTLSEWAMKVVVALCTKTGEAGMVGSPANSRYATQQQIRDEDTEPDLAFVRRFVLEHAIKAFKDASSSTEPLQTKYGRLLCLADLFNKLMTKPSAPDGAAGSHNTSYKMLARMMTEKNLIAILTSAISDIDLSFPSAKKVIKFILRPLQELTGTATTLNQASPEILQALLGSQAVDDISSASSDVSELEADREETPDLWSNSALGMLDPDRPDRSESSDAEDEDEDEQMYEMGYDDEMDLESPAMGAINDGEVVSDEELEEAGDPGPIEGLPGDVPMDIEFVMDPDGHDDDDDDDDDDEDSSDSSDVDEDDVGDSEEDEDADIEIEMEDDDEGDEIHNHNDVAHFNAHDNEDDWEDEDDDEDADPDQEDMDDDEDGDEVITHEDITFDGDDLNMPRRIDPPAHLNNLFRVMGEAGIDASDPASNLAMVVPQDDEEGNMLHEEDHDDDDDDDDDDEGVDEVDWHQGFDMMLDGPEDFDDNVGLDWDEPPPAMIRRHRHTRGPGGIPGFFTRRIMNEHDMHHHIMGPRHHRHAPSGRGTASDEGLNPLLQRPDPVPQMGVPGRPHHHHHHHSGPVEINFNMPMRGGPVLMPGAQGAMIGLPANMALGGHGAILDAILGAIQRGESEPDLLRNGQLTFNLSAPLSDIRDLLQPSSMAAGLPTPRQREDPSRSAQFVPMPTNTRWQEEARLLYGRNYINKIQQIQIRLLHSLYPLAQEEEKERRRKQEEERKAEEERQAQLLIEEEKRRKEEEEREAKEKAEAEERARTEAAEAAAREAEAHESEVQTDENTGTEAMEDVQSAPVADGEASAAQTEVAPRVYTTIRGRQLDITDLGIDPGYLEALPEDFRQEVIMGVYQERREQNQEEGRDESGIDPEFLEALPEDLRESLRREAAAQQRRQERDRARREAQDAAGLQATADMDNDDFFATLDPALRRQILAEQPPEVLNTLNAQHAAEGRAHARAMLLHHPIHGGRDLREERTRRDQAQREAKRQIVQLVDKAGVATLLRLMFLQQQGSLKSSLLHILGHVCGNRQTRFEIVSLLLVILKEGSTDVTAVERSLASLSLRAKATGSQKTPQPLKRTLSMQPYAGISEEVTPMLVVQQCLNTLSYICRQNFHVKALFLREVDVTSGPKPKSKSKGKGKESKTTKYPINDLISLLDRSLIMESSSCLHSLALLLATVTSPLALLIRQEKERVDAEKVKQNKAAEEAKKDSIEQPGEASIQSENTTTGEDTAMTDTVATSAEAASSAEPAADKSDLPEGEISEPEAEKRKQPFEPPTISDHNLKLIVSIFVANECGNETFHSTLETLESLAHVPGTSKIFGQELIRHVQSLSRQICTDLEDFLPAIRDAQSSTDVQGVAAARFSASTSDQVKLLRVLQALDYLSAPKKDDEPEEKSAKAKSILNMSYSTLSLGPLWSGLSDCLTAVEEKGDTISFANILLPLIESLMVVCKNTTLKDAPIAQQIKEGALTSPVPKDMSDLEELFFKFTSEHRKILNDIVRQMPKLMQGPFSILVKNSKVLDFDNKRNYFTKQIHSRHHAQRHPQPPLQLNVRRDQVFIDSYKALYFKTAEEMKHGKLNIRFNGEEGVDAGGVTREWFQVLARGMFDPNYALFHPVASDRTTFHPSTLSRINPEHLLYFKFVGRIIGKALHEGRVLDCHFSRAVYKRILGKSPNLKDLESNDMDYYKSLVWILENDITDILTEEFCVIEDEFGEEKIIDLIEDGRNIAVTEDNKKEYVQKLVEYRLTESVKEQLDSFLQGFHDIIPAELISIFNEQELELLISGLPEIDVDDWKANTEYHNYNPSSQQVVWFWRIVKAMSNEERAKLLQFITGTSKVPLNGFKELEGVSGLTKCNIHKDPSSTRLPTSHTCFNQLDLPAYDNFETMKHNLSTAISLGADYFGFA